MRERTNPSMVAGVLLSALLFLSGASARAMEDRALDEIVQGNNEFALDLYAELSEGEGNLFFSPYSISTALAMVYAGARGNTEKEMARTLHFTLRQAKLHRGFRRLRSELEEAQKESNVELSIANALWVQQGYELLKEYLELVREDYGAAPEYLDFVKAPSDACGRINTWVEEETRGKITKLIDPSGIQPLTRLVLTNAIYFKGKWKYQFKKENTRDEPFWLEPDRSVDVPMMMQKKKFAYSENDTLKVIELPYGAGDLSMLILLPGEKAGLSSLESALSPERLGTWTAELQEQDVIVTMPRFEMRSKFTLGKVLAGMGMRDAFSGAADFSGMAASDALSISSVVHKAYVDVNEEGTEAAAATGVVMLGTSLREAPKVFRADHPFVFLIKHRPTGSILFLGRVMNPAE